MSLTVVRSAPTSSGDLNARDLYLRDKYQRSTGAVRSMFYTLSSSTAYNTVAHTHTLESDTSGSFRVYTKLSGVGTSIDLTGTPTLSVAPSQTIVSSSDFKVTGTMTVDTVTTSTVGTSLQTAFPSDGSVTTVSYVGTSGTTVASLSREGHARLNGSLAVARDVLAAGNLNVAGDTALGGGVSVLADATSTSRVLFTGTSCSGIAVGTSVTSPLGTLYYTPATTRASGAGFVASIPLVYKGSTSVTEQDTSGSLTVYNKTTTSTRATLDNDNLSFSDKWRLRYNATDDQMVFEYKQGGVWTVKSRLAV